MRVIRPIVEDYIVYFSELKKIFFRTRKKQTFEDNESNEDGCHKYDLTHPTFPLSTYSFDYIWCINGLILKKYLIESMTNHRAKIKRKLRWFMKEDSLSISDMYEYSSL